MRRTLFILLGMPVLLGVGALNAPGLTVAGLQKEIANGARVTVVDIRSPVAFAKEHIPTAINIPAALCPLKKLPPLGQVVVYGDGLGREDVPAAAAALGAKPGIKAEILEGGFAGWQNSGAMTTRGGGFKKESFNYMSYAQLKNVKTESVVLYDLRKPAGASPLTDLKVEFPGRKLAGSRSELVQSAAVAPSVIVLIDNGDGRAELEARQLKISGAHNYVILAGGEMTLSRHGQAGLQRNAAGTTVVLKPHALSGTAN